MSGLNHNMNLQDAMEFVENKKAIFEAKTFADKVATFFGTLGYRLKVRGRMTKVWLLDLLSLREVQSSGVMCGFNAATGRVRLTIMMKNGDEASADYSVNGARAVAAELMRCADAVDIGINV